MTRTTDYGTLTGETTFEFIDGREGTEVIVPANIRADRPLRVWVVKPTEAHGWVVAGELSNV